MSRSAVPVLLVLSALTAVVFLPALGGGFVWDDQHLIVHNGLVRDPSRLDELLTGPFWRISSSEGSGNAAYDNLYRPAIGAVYAAEFALFGDHPLGWHLTSALVHVLCVLLAVLFVRERLPSDDSEASRVLAAGFGGVLFALHPSRSETVAWVSGSTDLFMTLGCLVGLACLARDQRRPSYAWLGCAFVAFLFAALCKEVALLVPVLLFTDGVLLGRPRATRARGVVTASLAAAVSVGLHLFFVPPSGGDASSSRALTHLPARIAASAGHLVERLFVGAPPTMLPAERFYDASGAPDYAGWAIALGAASLVLVVVLLGLGWRRPAGRPFVADLLWLALPLVPVLNLFPLNGPTLVAERFLYFPMLGASALFARAALALVRRGSPWRAAALGLTAALGLAMGLTTLEGIERFESDRALWAREVRLHPRSLYALAELASAFDGAHRFDDALRVHATRIRIASERNRPGDAVVGALDALKVMVTATSDADRPRLEAMWDAYEQMQRAGRLEIDLPPLRISVPWTDALRDELTRSVVLYRLPRAQLALRIGRLTEARAELEGLRRDMPREAMAWKLSAVAYARSMDFEAARAAMEEARRLRPDDGSVESLAARIEDAARIAGAPVVDELGAAVRDARIATMLGAPEAARERLEPILLAEPSSLEALSARIEADLSERRPDLARAAVARARLGAPARATELDAIDARLAAIEAEVDERRGRATWTAGTP